MFVPWSSASSRISIPRCGSSMLRRAASVASSRACGEGQMPCLFIAKSFACRAICSNSSPLRCWGGFPAPGAFTPTDALVTGGLAASAFATAGGFDAAGDFVTAEACTTGAFAPGTFAMGAFAGAPAPADTFAMGAFACTATAGAALPGLKDFDRGTLRRTRCMSLLNTRLDDPWIACAACSTVCTRSCFSLLNGSKSEMRTHPLPSALL
mmetsp:Transcript_109727/g.354267  ORF Transcript_109727/g.354267 Transcript_109727/m.354267 type:complete len:210 (-) Transcript_109727:1214-1843(-)